MLSKARRLFLYVSLVLGGACLVAAGGISWMQFRQGASLGAEWTGAATATNPAATGRLPLDDHVPTTAAERSLRDPFSGGADQARQAWFQVVALVVVGIGLLGWTATAAFLDGDPFWLWVVSWTVTATLLVAMVGLWRIERQLPPFDDYQQVIVRNDGEVTQYLQSVAALQPAGATPFDRLPVGLFVTSVDFESSIDIDVTGYLWHAHAVGEADPMVVLADANAVDFTEVARRPVPEGELTVWRFTATLREYFSYERFPFDRQQVWLRLRGVDPAAPVVPVPSFSGYRATDAGLHPGVASDLVLPEWDVLGSYFDFRVPTYTAHFGDPGFLAALPELYFNVEVRRRFLGPFVSYILPLGVAAAMLFALLLTCTKNVELTAFSGFTAKDVVLGVAALFFVVGFQHIALRTSLESANVIYLEYFYFVSYGTLLAVTADGILFAGRSRFALIEFRDNLVPKLAFWPTTMALLFVVTFLRFY